MMYYHNAWEDLGMHVSFKAIGRNIRAARTAALYSVDELKTLRQSHKNPDIIALYETWLGKPLGEKSHHLLHTHYNPQPREL